MAFKFKQREIAPDRIYNSVIVAKFINQIMKAGKKSKANKIVYGAFDIIKEKTKQEPLDVFEKAIREITPAVEVRPRRIGGATYQVPIEVNTKRGLSLAIRWILAATRAKKGKAMHEKLAEEILAASKQEGEAMKKKINVHRMAEANRAFAHLAKRRKK